MPLPFRYMSLHEDDTVCYCFHVSLRKIQNFCRAHKPIYPSQISECFSAGTGCGWCVPLLKRIHHRECGSKEPWWRQAPPEGQQQPTSADEYDSAESYPPARQSYLVRKKQLESGSGT